MKTAKYILFGWLAIFVNSAIIIGDILAIAFIDDWRALAICLSSIVLVPILVGVTVSCFEKVE